MKNLLLALCVIVLGIGLWWWGAHDPFVGSYQTNNNYLSLAAKNYVRFGFSTLQFAPTYFAGYPLPADVPFYLHHPILIFILSALPFMVFGFGNWVVHAANFVFMVGSLGMIYVVGTLVWNKRVGLWSAALMSIFPMTGFYWKYIFFEQGSLFFILLSLYYTLRYITTPHRKFLVAIGISAFLGGLIDWGVLYFFVPFVPFFFSTYRKAAKKIVIVYGIGTCVSLSVFAAHVYWLQGGFAEMLSAIWARSYTSELLTLSWWPVRLGLISIIRVVLYFTPLSFLWLWHLPKEISRKSSHLPTLILSFFGLYGLLNLIVLPTASWGHSYFLFYAIPFFAYAGALWMTSPRRNWVIVASSIVLVIASSILVHFLKLQQLRKQVWKYDIAVSVAKTLAPYEPLGVTNFSGDVFEYYFLHPTQPISFAQLAGWAQGTIYPHVTHTVFVCAGPCSDGEREQVAALKVLTTIVEYKVGENQAWLLTRSPSDMTGKVKEEHVAPQQQATVTEGHIILTWYRWLRDFLNAGQI